MRRRARRHGAQEGGAEAQGEPVEPACPLRGRQDPGLEPGAGGDRLAAAGDHSARLQRHRRGCQPAGRAGRVARVAHLRRGGRSGVRSRRARIRGGAPSGTGGVAGREASSSSRHEPRLPRRGVVPPVAGPGRDHRGAGGLRPAAPGGEAGRRDPDQPRQPGRERARERPALREAGRKGVAIARSGGPGADGARGGAAPHRVRGSRRPDPDGGCRLPAPAELHRRSPPPSPPAGGRSWAKRWA